MFVDRGLAQRIDRVEGVLGKTYTEPRTRVSGIPAAWCELGGAVVVFDGAESPLTQTFGLGMIEPATHDGLAQIEAFYAERGAPTQHEVSPYAGVATTALLVERGYHPIEMSTVLVQQLLPRVVSTPLTVRRIDPDVDGDQWIETSVAGWSSEPEAVPVIRGIAEVNIANREVIHYIVERSGEPIASGSLAIVDDIAILAGASTLPAARGQGAQAALLATRLADACERGAAYAVMLASVGSLSQKNAQRNGFTPAYTRTKWQLARR